MSSNITRQSELRRLRELAAAGYCLADIARELERSTTWARKYARQLCIEVTNGAIKYHRDPHPWAAWEARERLRRLLAPIALQAVEYQQHCEHQGEDDEP